MCLVFIQIHAEAWSWMLFKVGVHLQSFTLFPSGIQAEIQSYPSFTRIIERFKKSVHLSYFLIYFLMCIPLLLQKKCYLILSPLMFKYFMEGGQRGREEWRERVSSIVHSGQKQRSSWPGQSLEPGAPSKTVMEWQWPPCTVSPSK